MSALLDEHPKLLDGIATDLKALLGVDCRGLTGETVLRCVVLLHLRQSMYGTTTCRLRTAE